MLCTCSAASDRSRRNVSRSSSSKPGTADSLKFGVVAATCPLAAGILPPSLATCRFQRRIRPFVCIPVGLHGKHHPSETDTRSCQTPTVPPENGQRCLLLGSERAGSVRKTRDLSANPPNHAAFNWAGTCSFEDDFDSRSILHGEL